MKRMSTCYVSLGDTLVKVIFLREIKSKKAALVRLENRQHIEVSMNKVLTEEEGAFVFEHLAAPEDGVEVKVLSNNAENWVESNSTEDYSYYWEDDFAEYSLLGCSVSYLIPDDFTVVRYKNRVLKITASELCNM